MRIAVAVFVRICTAVAENGGDKEPVDGIHRGAFAQI